MIGAIIGAVGSIAAAGISAASSRKQQKRADAERKRQQQRLDEWYGKHGSEDTMQLADVQAALNSVREMSREQIAAARGRSAVMGGSTQEVAAAQESANRMTGDVARSIAATGTARKDAADDVYRTGSSTLAADRINNYNTRAAAIADAGNTAISSGMSMVGADAQSYLDSGRGLFENLWKNRNNKAGV